MRWRNGAGDENRSVNTDRTIVEGAMGMGVGGYGGGER